MYEIQFTPRQIKFMKREYEHGVLTVQQIADELGVDDDTVRRKAKKLGIKKKVKTIWTPEKEAWLKKNYNKPYKEMIAYLQMSEWSIQKKINDFGLIRTHKHKPFKIDYSDEEFFKDIDNPTLSAPDIAEKYKDIYGVCEGTIQKIRRNRGIKLQINTLSRESSAEKEVREILDILGLAYIKEKSVGKYHIDFYLGYKGCIEVQGRYWHSKPKRIATDKRKLDYLSKLGYKVLYIWDDELDKARDEIVKFIVSLGLPHP